MGGEVRKQKFGNRKQYREKDLKISQINSGTYSLIFSAVLRNREGRPNSYTSSSRSFVSLLLQAVLT